MARLFHQAESASAPWPIKGTVIKLSADQLKTAKRQADQVLRDRPNLFKADAFGDGVSAGYKEGPCIFLEDHLKIELMPPRMVAGFEYRSLGLARTGDVFILSRPRSEDFETYLEKSAGLGRPQILEVDRGATNLPKGLGAASLNQTEFDRLCYYLGASKCVNIFPYLASGDVWQLGAKIAKRCAKEVSICGPTPQISKLVNNKLWFAAQTRALLGRGAVPLSFSSFSPSAAAAQLKYLSKRCDMAVLKTPSSAGSMGNWVFESSVIKAMTLKQLRDEILGLVQSKNARVTYPLLVGVWESGALASPSVQIWIPPEKSSPPIVEGIFEQRLAESEQRFVGAASANLPAEIMAQLSQDAAILSTFLQFLGYVGRLSFDALLVGEHVETAQIHWIECNGRWGGVSIPLTITHRLPSQSTLSIAVVQQKINGNVSDASFKLALKATEHLLHPRTDKKQGIIFLQPIDQMSKSISFVSFAPSRKAAIAAADQACKALGDIGSKVVV